MSNSITFKGISSNTISGLLISELPPITKPKMRVKETVIDGVDGSLLEDLGYESYSKKLNIGLTRNFDIDKIIEYFNGEGNVTFSNESDKYYKAKIVDSIDFNRLIRFRKADVNFIVQPYKYKLNESKVDVTVTNQSEIKVTNVGLEVSKPIITLYGSGELHFYLNTVEIFKYTFDTDGQVVIDSEKEDAYLNGVLKNRQMLGEFPFLKSGENTITWTGTLTRIVIDPKSRWL